MNIKIRSTNFEITPAISDYVYKKVLSLEKVLGYKNEILCEVEIGKTTGHHKSGEIFKMEINIKEPKGQQYFITAEEEDLYSAIDVARDNAEETISSKRKKFTTIWRKSAAKLKSMMKRIDWRKNG